MGWQEMDKINLAQDVDVDVDRFRGFGDLQPRST
jgi:hypothetical protein